MKHKNPLVDATENPLFITKQPFHRYRISHDFYSMSVCYICLMKIIEYFDACWMTECFFFWMPSTYNTNLITTIIQLNFAGTDVLFHFRLTSIFIDQKI